MDPDLEIRKSNINGTGVFATKGIKKGEMILDWKDVSDIITKEQFKNLSLEEKKHVSVNNDEYILFKGVARHVNHSCDPNMIGKDKKDFAKKDINKGEEITVDYELENNQVPFTCNCQSKNCKKIISA